MSTREEYEVSLDDFIDTFVPDLPANLEISLVLHHMLNLHTWNDFSSYPTTDDQSDILKQLFDKSVNAAQYIWEESCPEQRWSLITGATLNTPKRTSTIKPDAFVYRTGNQYSHSHSYSYDHVAFLIEFKKTTDPLDVSPECRIPLIPLSCFQNSSNIVHGMEHIMAVDPRRRFTFGITIMGTSLGLWYTNRSMLVSSKHLNIIKVVSTCLLVFCLLSANTGQGVLAQGPPVIHICIRCGHGLRSFCQAHGACW